MSDKQQRIFTAITEKQGETLDEATKLIGRELSATEKALTLIGFAYGMKVATEVLK